MKLFYLMVFVSMVSVTSCRTKDGEPGPAGESTLVKQGSISATITYTDDNGNDATVPFDYQFYETLYDSRFYYEDNQGEISYGVDVRRRDLRDENNSFNFIVEKNIFANIGDDPHFTRSEFSFNVVINNDLFEFYNYGYGPDVTNFTLDPSTGRVTFDFSGSIYKNGEAATITGRVDVILYRTREYITVGG
jgi:hypothetical protein